MCFFPMVDDEKRVDLYKLLTLVERKGGFEAVCNGELWDLVGEECGLGVNVGSSVKLFFSKYKRVLESCTLKISDGKVIDECRLMESEAEVKGVLSDKVENVVAGEAVKGEVDGVNETKSLNLDSSGVKEVHNGGCPDSEMTNQGIGNIAAGLDLSGSDGGSSGLKRKRESLFDFMSWVTRAAKNPCDPEIGYMPDKSKWKIYSNQEAWKRVLSFREAAFLKKHSSIEQQNWQSQKMHPNIYDSPAQTIYNLRDRLKRKKKLSSDKQKPSSPRSSSNSSIQTEGDLERSSSPRTEDRDITSTRSKFDRWSSKRIRVGPKYQAQVPEWTDSTSESDPKWFGTQIWPLETVNPRLLIERDPIGKGRQDSCGCGVPGSVECVRFHISERKAKVKLELGMAFYHWKLDTVGEDVRHLWMDEEEKKFREVIKENPPSSERYFWDHIFQAFPHKSRATLVSYYFNVYLLQCRAYQNRHTPNKIDSDDEESESDLRNCFGHQTPNSCDSILTPKKKRKTGGK